MPLHPPAQRTTGGQIAGAVMLALAGSAAITAGAVALLSTYGVLELPSLPRILDRTAPAATAPAVPAAAAAQQAAVAARLPLPVVQTPAAAVTRPLPIPPVGRVATARRAPDGHFYFDTALNGLTVRMVFDTGASVVVLRAEDAGRAGIAVNGLSYSALARTANGTAEVAPVTLDALRVGDITRYGVPALVSRPGALSISLLGQSFMSRLTGYRFEAGELILQGD